MSEENERYNLEQACDILQISHKRLYSLASSGRIKSYRDDKTTFDKVAIDAIAALLIDTYSFKEVVKFVVEQPNLLDIHTATVMNYMKKFDVIINPMNGKDTRFYKSNMDKLISLLNENYKGKVTKKLMEKESGRRSLFQLRIDNYRGVVYLSEEMQGDVYNFEFLQKYTKDRTLTTFKNIDRFLRYMLNVCKEQKIEWYTNANHSDIYIKKSDFPAYKNHYKNIKQFNSNDYYRTDEVKSIFGIASTDGVAKFANSIKVSGLVYFEKEKIDELIKVIGNTVTTNEIQEIYNIPTTTFYRLLESLDIKYIPRRQFPLLESNRIYKSELKKFDDYFSKKELFDSISRYERFYIEVDNIRTRTKIPKTIEAYDKFIQKRLKENGNKYVYTNLVNVYVAIIPLLEKEIMLHTMEELIPLIEVIPQVVAKREFSFFVDFCRSRYETNYKESFELDGTAPEGTEAYTFKQWLDFGVILFMKHEILLPKAIESRTNAMVWLYCAMHYVCGWRTDDIITMPYPKLIDILEQDEEEVFQVIAAGQFTEEMAQRVVNYLVIHIKTFGTKPEKTHKNTRTSELKFAVDETYVETIGLLIALCAVHRKRVEMSEHRWLNSSSIMTRRVTKKDAHLAFFGEEYEEIFGTETFLNRNAIKTYMNLGQVISQEKKWGNGYHMGAFIRSHGINKKLGYSNTTQVYLESINKSDDVHRITSALTERGSFGFMSHLFSEILTNEGAETVPYAQMSWNEQNVIIKEFFDLDPFQIERMVRGIGEYQNKVSGVFRELMTVHKDNIKEVLLKLSVGDYPSKMEFTQCLLKTINRSTCAYPVREHCIGCEYALHEMYFLIEFNQRLKELLGHIRFAKQNYDKQRYTHALFFVYLPVLKEAVRHFGKERVGAFIHVPGDEIKKLKENSQFMLDAK